MIVSIAELKLDALTAEDGTFFFHGVPPGKYNLLAIDSKYDRFSRPIELSKRGSARGSLVDAAARRQPLRDRARGREGLVRGHEANADAAAAVERAGNFRRSDPRDPGRCPVSRARRSGLGLLLIRGSNPDDSGIFVDGHEGAGAVPLS